ncbi:MAG: hypothetical protein H6741_15660 [Alphaproteobacteria bacterium]|nr:hypothetical protein [Alphaproteobacteria bacterium]
MRASLLLTALLLACQGKDGTTEDTAFIVGDVVTTDETASVALRTAYGFHIDGKGLWYMSTVAGVSCDEVLTYLNHAGSDVHPEGVLYGGYCNLTLVSDYEGEDFSFTEADGTFVGYWSLYCPMGEGEWVWENRDGHEDYYWSNRLWTGDPEVHSTTITGDGETEGYTITVDMSDYSGTYAGVLETIPATGSVAGTIDAVFCPELYQADAWPTD